MRQFNTDDMTTFLNNSIYDLYHADIIAITEIYDCMH